MLAARNRWTSLSTFKPRNPKAPPQSPSDLQPLCLKLEPDLTQTNNLASAMKQRDAPNPVLSNRRPPHLKHISDSLGEIAIAACLQPLDVIKTRCSLIGLGTTCAFRMASIAPLHSLNKDYKTGKYTSTLPLLSAIGALLFVETFAICTPLEVVKIRLQEQRGVNPVVLKYKSAMQCAGMIIREEGIRRLWAGATPTLMRNALHSAAAQGALMMILRKKSEANQRKAFFNPLPYWLPGMLAFVTATIFSNPFDVIKTRLMAQPQSGQVKYKGMIHTMRTIYAEEGLPAFWRGTMARVMWKPPALIVASVVSYHVYGLYDTSPNINETDKIEPASCMRSAFCIKVVKTRLQQERGVNPVVLKYKSPMQCGRKIIGEEGLTLTRLWAGAGPNFVTASNAIMRAMLRGITNVKETIFYRLLSGKDKYKDMRRIYAEEGLQAFWRDL
ncbi:mitochondrial succinate-fumarate transporter 1 [Senna tora]|uniref:Mitochondrial succinate-fumarate transporter 1 n=1 Tax=Senna tora TaxID=362788 RepID=A0A834T780_9FABA|nr:mitochondrial succinate-fumarate transporter 1 [Senna tora]